MTILGEQCPHCNSGVDISLLLTQETELTQNTRDQVRQSPYVLYSSFSDRAIDMPPKPEKARPTSKAEKNKPKTKDELKEKKAAKAAKVNKDQYILYMLITFRFLISL